jgi:inosine-uridine nucleoside N-ribohydrolase
VTLAAPLTLDELSALGRSTRPGAGVVHRVWERIFPSGRLETGEDGCWPAHDLLATWATLHPEVCEWASLPLAIDLGGSAAWGATIADGRLPRLQRWAQRWGSPEELERIEETRHLPANRWDVALGVDAAGFRAGVRAWLAGPS